jgi:hypothetical protein
MEVLVGITVPQATRFNRAGAIIVTRSLRIAQIAGLASDAAELTLVAAQRAELHTSRWLAPLLPR